MKRVARILLNTATVLSIASSAATTAWWVRSYSHTDEVYRNVRTYDVRAPDKQMFASDWWLASSAGGILLYRQYGEGAYWDGPEESGTELREGIAVDEELGRRQLESAGLAIEYGRHFAGFAWLRDPSIGGSWILRVPFWAVIVACASLPATRAAMALRRRWLRRNGLCTACGYDLRATSTRCPECGTIPAGGPS